MKNRTFGWVIRPSADLGAAFLDMESSCTVATHECSGLLRIPLQPESIRRDLWLLQDRGLEFLSIPGHSLVGRIQMRTWLSW
jgi:hypothetical protein